MIFAKNKKQEAEERKLRFIEHTLYSFLRNVKAIECNKDKLFIDSDKIKKMKKEMIDEVIEYRAKEILDWT